MTPEGEPSGTVTRGAPTFDKVPGRPVTVDLRVSAPPPAREEVWSWWATVDRHPYSDKLRYESEGEARDAAEAWVKENFPDRAILFPAG